MPFRAVSPSEYRVEISAEVLSTLPESAYLDFSEAYHPDWKVRVGNFSWWDALRRPGYFLPDAIHTENDAGLNAFRLDRSALIPDSDGVVRLTVFFRPQAHLYLGLWISGGVLVLCLAFLIRAWSPRRAGDWKKKS